MAQARTNDNAPDPWDIVRRIQEFRGEETANALRVGAIACFYLIELATYHGLPLPLGEAAATPELDPASHGMVTALTTAWVTAALAVLMLLRNRVFPFFLKYVTAAVDVVLLTIILMVAEGPLSPLIAVYFLLLGAAALRMSHGLVWAATSLSMASYMMVIIDAALLGDNGAGAIHRHLIVLLTLGFTGLLLVRMLYDVRRVVGQHAAHVVARDEGEHPFRKPPAGRCASCRAIVVPGSARCWLCGQLTSPGSTSSTVTATATAPTAGRGWLGVAAIALATMIVLGIEVGMLWPGLLVPYAALSVPLVVALVRLVVRSMREETQTGEQDRRHDKAPARKVAMERLVTGVGLFAAGVGAAVLMAGTAIIYLVIICFASMGLQM